MGIDIRDAQRALREGEFLPWFQPLVVLRTGALAGFEVLARWRHGEKGMISPEVFIPYAERDGWIDELTREILRKAFLWGRAIPSPLFLGVNISPVQLGNRELPAQIEEISQDAGLPLQRVMVEITESALADNLEQARGIAVDLKRRGCKLALDDFGTGYSSLRHLQSIPFDEIKVDRSFVSSMTERRESRKIVAAVVGLGQSLGLTTVAEGVETEEQAEMLLWLGCDIAQGWLYGKPVPGEQLQEETVRPRRTIFAEPGVSTDRRRTGHNLEGIPGQRLAHLQAIYDGAPVGLAFLDRNLRHINLNRHMAEMNGLPVGEHLGKTVEELFPETFAVIAPYLRLALEGEVSTACEIRAPGQGTHGGRVFLASYQPARDEAGEVVGVSVAVLDFTERKRAEERLLQYERVVEGLDEMITVVDRDYRYVLANRAFLVNRNMTLEELIGRKVPELIDHDIFEKTIKPKLEACFAGEVVKYELRYEYPVLGERDLSIAYYPIEVSGGVTGAACVLRDMSELKHLERTNANWHKRIEMAQQSGLRIGLWDWDIEANMVLWSDESYRQWGYTRQEFSGCVEEAVDRIHPEDRPRVEQAIESVLSGREKQYAARYRVVRPDGSIGWIDARGVLVHDGSSRMVGVGVDITQLMEVERSRQESEELYLLLLNSTAEAIYGMDLEGSCTFCNPACLRMLGYSALEDLLGKNMHRLTHHTRADGSPIPFVSAVSLGRSAGAGLRIAPMRYCGDPMERAFRSSTGRTRCARAVSWWARW